MFNKKQLAFLVIFVLIFTYFSAGFLVFFLNKITLLEIVKYYSYDFTFQCIIQGYPNIEKALLYAFLFWSFMAGILILKGNDKALHGDARFASFSEIKKKWNLLTGKGLIVGKYKDKLLRFDSQEFVALGSPTRKGKGVANVIPNLLEWKESTVVLDIKQECFDYTSKYRKEKLGQEVFLFNPFSYTTNKYNPLSSIDMTDSINRDKTLLDFASLLYPLVGSETQIFFNQQAQNLFIGICYLYKDLALTKEGQDFLEEYDLEVEFTMNGLLKLSEGFEIEQEPEIILNDDGEEEEEEIETLRGLQDTYDFLIHLEILSEEAKDRLSSFINIASVNTKSGVESSFNAPLMIYRNEPIKSATSSSDFDLKDLRKKKMTIYIGITPNDLEMAKPILNIFFSQLISLNTQELPEKNSALKYSCLLLLDEFVSIGYMPILLKSVSYIAGYNLRLLTIFQSLSQLETPVSEGGYGMQGAKTLLNNHAIKIFYAPEQDEAEKLSKRLGDTTVKVTSKSQSSGRALLEHGTHGRNTSEQRRALMLPQELMELEFKKQIITKAGEKTILSEKAFYYEDSYFIDKLKSVSPTLNKINGLPNYQEIKNALKRNELNINIKNIRN